MSPKIDLADGSWESTSLTQTPAEPRPPKTPEGAEDWQLVGETAAPDPRTGYLGALGQNPDRVAEVENLSNMTGIDQSLLEKNIDKGRDAANKPDFEKLVLEYPALARSMTDDRFAAVSKDDVNELMAVNDAYGPAVDEQRAMRHHLDSGVIPGIGSDFSAISQTAGARAIAGLQKGSAGLISWYQETAFQHVRGREKEFGIEADFEMPKELFNEAQMVLEQIQKDKPLQTKTGQIFAGAIDSILQQVPAIAGSILVGKPEVGLMILGSNTFGQTYADSRAGGMTHEDAFDNASVQAAAEVGTEMIPFFKLAGMVSPTKKFTREAIQYAVAEFPGEALATAIQESSDVYFSEEDPAQRMAAVQSYLGDPANWTQSQIDTFLQTLVQTTIMAGGAKIARAGTDTFMRWQDPDNHYQKDLTEVEKAERNSDLYKSLAGSPVTSKLAKRIPKRMKEFVQQIQADGGIEKIYIDGEVADLYFQSADKKEMERIEAAIPGITAKIMEAKSLGTNIEVDSSDFAAHIAPLHGDLLWQDIKIEDGAMSINEANAWKDKQETEYQAALEREQLNEDQINAIETSADLVFEDQIQQLTASGRYTEQQARAQATAVKLFFRTMAAREGMDPKELYDSYGLSIKTELPAGAQAMVDQAVLEDEDITQLTGIFNETGEVTVGDFTYRRETVDGEEVVNAYQVGATDQAPVQVDNIEEHIRANDQQVLTEGQVYNQQGQIVTDTPAFNEWFGESKIIDEQGEPLVVYHGTKADISVFDGKVFPGWFTDDSSRAGLYAGQEEGANILPLYAKVEKPLDLTGSFDINDRGFAIDFIEQAGLDNAYADGASTDPDFDFPTTDIYALEIVNTPGFVKAAIANGYDGIIINEQGVKTFAVFEPTQIKSTSNRGTFDPSDPNILQQAPVQTFEPQNVTAETLPESTAGVLPSKAEQGQYYNATADGLQSYLDTHGDGFLYRVTRMSAIEQGFDVGLPGYKHQFKDSSAKVYSFSSSFADTKAFLEAQVAESPDARYIVYRMQPQDLADGFAIQVPSERSNPNTVHVQSPLPAGTNLADVIYRNGEFTAEEATDDDRRIAGERRRAAGARRGPADADELRLREATGRPGVTGTAVEQKDLLEGDEDVDMQNVLQQSELQPDLFVAHNLNANNLVFADKVGGLAVPSIAVGRTSTGGFNNFGEISLLANPDLLMSGQSRVFNADVYSPRYPKILHKIDHRKLSELNNELKDSKDALGNPSGMGDLEDRGMQDVIDNTVVQYEYLKSIGKAPKITKKKHGLPKKMRDFGWKGSSHFDIVKEPEFMEALKQHLEKEVQDVVNAVDEKDRKAIKEDMTDTFFDENGEVRDRHIMNVGREIARSHEPDALIDFYNTRDAIQKKMSVKKTREGFEEWAHDKFGPVFVGERIFNGFTNAGDRKYLKHDLDTVVKILKKELRDGEGFNYGVGSIRSKVAKEFKSIKSVQKDREQIVSGEEMQKVKDEVDEEFIDLTEELKPYYKFDSSSFGYLDAASNAFKDFADRGVRGFEEDYSGTPDELMEKVGEFMQKLRNMPTEYFEAKIGRAVDISEFGIAVVPKDIPRAALDVLKEQGLKVKKYDRNDPDGRKKAIEDLQSTNPELFFQAKAGGARGAISLTDGTTDLFILENADLSTYLHEVGHLFNKVMEDLSTREGASDQLQKDWAGLQKWLSVLDDDKGLIPQYNKYLRDTAVFGGRDFNALSDAEQESAREKAKLEYFARGFEAYLIEGKAPSSEMRSIFTQFKAWMKAIYASVKSLNIKLSPQVEAIYDRLFATDEEIAAAEYEMAYASLFTDATAAGMTEEEFAAYQGAVIKAREQAEEELMVESMKQIAREKTEAFRARKKEITEEVTEEVNQRQVYIARSVLRHGRLPDGTEVEDDAKIKLSSPDLKDRGYTGKDLKPLAFMHVKEGGADIDTAAELFGYESGEEMVSAFEAAPPRAEAIKEGTDLIVQAEFGDVMGDPDAMHEEAIEAVHGTKRGSLLMTELKRLGKLSGDQQVAPEKVIKLAAERIVNEKLVRDLRPDQYQRAEAKAGRDVLKLVAKGEFEKAFQVQQRRVLNHHLYRASRDAKVKVDKQVRAMQRLAKPAAQKRIAKAKGQYLDQINALLDRFDFANVSLVKLDKRKSFAEFVQQIENEGTDIVVDQALFNEAMRINYKDLEVQHVNSVVETIKHLEHLATTKNKLLDLKEEKLLDEAVDELVMSAREHGKQQKKKPLDPRTVSRWGKLSNNLKDFDASLLKAEQVFDWLDGGDVDGPWSSYIWDAFAKAQDDESIILDQYLDPLAKMILELTRERGAKMLDRVDIPEINESITRSGLLSIALNLGNDSNANKLINGYGWTDDQVRAIIDRLTEDDWKFVQGVWDLIDGLWPDIIALEQKVRGLKPEKVEPRPIPTKYGTFRGGYFPIVYDHDSIAGSKQLSSEQKSLFETTTTRATTPRGHTKARIDTFAAPILLDIGIIPQHLGKVIHDLTHRTAVMNANKLMGRKEVRDAITENLGAPYVGMIDRWVQGVANDRAFFPEDGLGVWMKFLRRFRLNTSVVAMGFKATTMFSQFAGLTQSLDMIEKKYLVSGLQKITKSPRKTTDWIFSLSREMHDRIYQRDRDIRDGLRDLVGKTDFASKIKEVAFVGIGYADLYVAGATWVGAYEQKIDAGDSIETAVRFADRVVRLTQGSGAAKDLAQVQREGNEVMKMLTMFYSYFSALYNRQRDLGRKVGSEDSYRRSIERALFLIVIPAIMGEILAGRGPREDEDEEFPDWAAKTILIYPFMTVPLVRDVISSVESGYDYRFSPMVSAGEKMVRVATQTSDAIAGEGDWSKVAKSSFEASGYILGLPTGQAAITGGYIYDILTGEDDIDNPGDMMGFLFRREND